MAPHPLLDINLVRGTDMEHYIQWGRRIAEGDWLGRGEGAFVAVRACKSAVFSIQ